MNTSAAIDGQRDERHEFYAYLEPFQMLRMGLDDAQARFSDLSNPDRPVVGRLANQNILHVRLKDFGLGQEDDRWLGTLAPYRPYHEYSAGKLITVEYTEGDSHRADPSTVAGLNSPSELAKRNNITALGWNGGVFRSESYTRNDGPTLTVRVGASASGVQGYLDQVVAAAAADTYVALWLLREKARDVLGIKSAA